MKIAILGSCVTRDMTQFLPKQIQLVLYAARTSFVSLAAESVPIEENEILIEQSFNRKAVYWDMTKAFWQKLEEAAPDILFIDFIDERFDLWRNKSQMITRSNYLSMSNVEKEYLAGFELLHRDSQQTHELWRRSCEVVVPRIKKVCKRIILHRSLWAEKYYIDENVVAFDEANRQLATGANLWLNDYYDYFISVCPDAKEVRVADELCVSNFAHKWGRDFFHYGDSYYKKLAEMVLSLLTKG